MTKTWSLYISSLLLFSSCASAYLTVKSNPEGASIYVIPSAKWNTDSVAYSKPENISDYIVKDGVTPLHLIELYPKSYVVVLALKNQTAVKHVDLSDVRGKQNFKIVEVEMK